MTMDKDREALWMSLIQGVECGKITHKKDPFSAKVVVDFGLRVVLPEPELTKGPWYPQHLSVMLLWALNMGKGLECSGIDVADFEHLMEVQKALRVLGKALGVKR